MMDSAMGKKNDALGLLGFVTGLVNQELLLRKNTSWQRTAFCKPGSKDDYGHRKARRPPLRRSPNGGGKALADIDWCCEAGHPCGSVSEADRAEVRPFQTARILGAPAIGAGSRGAGGKTPEPPQRDNVLCLFLS